MFNLQLGAKLTQWFQNPAFLVLLVYFGSTIRGGHHLNFWLLVHIGLLFYSQYWSGRLVFDRWVQVYGGLALFSLMSLGWAYDPELGWTVVVRVLRAFLAILIIINSIRNRAELMLFMQTYCLFLAVLSAFAMLGVSGEEEAEFLFGSKNTIGPMAVCLLTANLLLWQLGNRLLIVTLPLALLAVVWSTSLKSFLAVVIFGFTMVAISILDIKRLAAIYKLGVVSTLIFVLAVSAIDIGRFERAYLRIESRLEHYAQEIGWVGSGFEIDSGSQIELRSNFVESGLRYFMDAPIHGHGANQFRILYAKETGFQTYSHNTFIELLVGLGSIGCMMFVYFLWKIAKKSWRFRRDPIGTMVFSYLLAFIVLGSAQEVFYNIPFLALLTIGDRYFVLSERQQQTALVANQPSSRFSPSRLQTSFKGR